MVDPLAFTRSVVQETGTDLSSAAASAIPTTVRVLVTSSCSASRYESSPERSGGSSPGRTPSARRWSRTSCCPSSRSSSGVGLAVLSMLGLEAIAASLGTATGFVALGVSYALSDMIEDTVARVYLLRDPDFEHGDRVQAASTTGTVQSIELRKCRVETDDGDVVVLANRNVESGWTKRSEPSAT